MGYRKGLCRALEKLQIPYGIWHPKPIKTSRQAIRIVTAAYPKSHAELVNQLPEHEEINHVIAGTEDSVFPASLVRKWLGTRRNSLSVAAKCTDKAKMKIYLKEHQIPMTSFLTKKNYVNKQQILKELGDKVVVKPRKSSGSRGLKILSDSDEIAQALNNRTLLEKAIEGSEGSIESIIEDGEIRFTNITQYKEIGAWNYIPGHNSNKVNKEIRELNESVVKALKIKWGITHLEYYNTKAGLLFGEIALRPPGGYIMDTLNEIYDFDFWQLLVKVELGLALGELPVRKKYGASIIIYPELGVISKIVGQEEVEGLESLVRFRLKAKVGQTVSKRMGVGEDFGYGLFAHEDKQQLKDDLKTFRSSFKIISNASE